MSGHNHDDELPEVPSGDLDLTIPGDLIDHSLRIWKAPEFKCEKHGVISSGVLTFNLPLEGTLPAVERSFCGRCLIEAIRRLVDDIYPV